MKFKNYHLPSLVKHLFKTISTDHKLYLGKRFVKIFKSQFNCLLVIFVFTTIYTSILFLKLGAFTPLKCTWIHHSPSPVSFLNTLSSLNPKSYTNIVRLFSNPSSGFDTTSSRLQNNKKARITPSQTLCKSHHTKKLVETKPNFSMDDISIVELESIRIGIEGFREKEENAGGRSGIFPRLANEEW